MGINSIPPNKIRITLVCFLAYFVMSGALSPIGIIIGPMAEYFSLPVTEVAALFSWLTMGILIGSISALFIFDVIAIKKILIAIYCIILASFVSLSLHTNILLIGFALGSVGVCCGIGLAGAASLISTLYKSDTRASMLVITDGSFSVAGIVCSAVAVYLIGKQFHWSGAYLFVAAITALIIFLTLLSTIPELARSETQIDKEETSANAPSWPLSIYLCIAALFLYTLGQYSLLWWLPNYLEVEKSIPKEKSGAIVSQFWMGMFAAQIFVAWWVLKIGVGRLLITGTIMTTLASIPLWLWTDVNTLSWLAFFWGFANLGLLKIIISAATLMVEKVPPRLISALLLGATCGTAVSPWVTSGIVEILGSYRVLQFGSFCYLILTCLLIVAYTQSLANKKT